MIFQGNQVYVHVCSSDYLGISDSLVTSEPIG